MRKISKFILLVITITLLLPLSSFTNSCASGIQPKCFSENPMNNIEIICEGTFWLMAILRGDVFTTKITNKNNIFYRYAIKIWVEKPGNSTILGPYEDLYKIEPHSIVRYHLCDFYDFREAGCLFSFFYVYCELTIIYGFTQYSITKRFPGFIWVISARILNENGKVI